MLKKVSILFFLAVLTAEVHAQEFGLSFSYFIPKNGEISTPVSPFSIRGIGVSFNKFVGIETGASLYRMAGLSLKDLPLNNDKSLLGPNFTIFVPAELVFQFGGSKAQFDIKGGGFAFYGFAQRLNYGNIDRAIRSLEQAELANADLSFKNNPGFGYHAGAELTVYVSGKFGVSLEGNYLMGSAKFPLSGSYTYSTATGTTTTAVDYKDAKVDFSGVEISIGVSMLTGGGKAKPKRRRR